MVQKNAELKRTLKEVMQEYRHICWCPTSNNYPALYYLSELYRDQLGIHPEDAPDLFVISDVRPPVNMGYYTPVSLGRTDWRDTGRLYPENDGMGHTCDELDFSADVVSIERLKDVRIKNALGMDMDAVNESVRSGWNADTRGMVNTNGRCFLMHLSLSSGDRRAETDLVYVYADPLRFATDFLLRNDICPQYISYGTYQQGFDGLDSGIWLSCIIPLLKPSYLLADTAYLNGSILRKFDIPDNEYTAMKDALRPLQFSEHPTLWDLRSVVEPAHGKTEVSWNSRSYIKHLGFYEAVPEN